MKKLKEALKTALIHAQSLTKTLPANMADLDTSIFDAALKPIAVTLQTLHQSCEEALTDEWDRSDDGFRAMQESIEEHIDIDYSHEAYQDQDEEE